MKKILLLLLALFIMSCKKDTTSFTDEAEDNYNLIENTKTVEKSSSEEKLPNYATIKEMFEASGDFSEEVGSLKFISLDKLHIQVSKPIVDNDMEDLKNELVKRDIVYVAFQTFAQTDIDELTITSVPNSFDDQKKYFEKYKRTLTINRNKAKSLLKKYLNTEDFSILYIEQDGIWLPSKSFDILKFEKLNEVFIDMIPNKKKKP